MVINMRYINGWNGFAILGESPIPETIAVKMLDELGFAVQPWLGVDYYLPDNTFTQDQLDVITRIVEKHTKCNVQILLSIKTEV